MDYYKHENMALFARDRSKHPNIEGYNYMMMGNSQEDIYIDLSVVCVAILI